MPPQAWTRRSAAYPRDQSVHEVFREVAGRLPGQPAIRSENGEITYVELDRRAHQLAHHLIAQGLAGGARVGVLLERSPELIIAQLAILKAGGVYVPIDPGAPAERIGHIARASGLWRIICTGDPNTIAIPAELGRLALDVDADAICSAPDSGALRAATGGDAAYIMFTSGSTGVPKGVVTTHRGILRLVLAQPFFPAGPGQCVLLLGSPGFDGTTYEIWSALLNGGCCAVFPDHRVDPRRLREVIRSLRVSCLMISTGLFNRIIDHDPQTLGTAGHVIVGGEALSVAHILKAREALPGLRLCNGYVPTECTTFAVSWEIGDPADWGCESVPLGFPIENTECLIVDSDAQPVAVGVVGELLLGGDGLALGYLDRPDLTSERFIRHPFSADPGARLYRTGDRCHWLPNGMIAYVGRNDDQVKIRGHRIEPGEVEAALRSCTGIDNAAVVVWQFVSGVRGLVACVVPKPGFAWQEAANAEELARWLPEPMLPSRLIRLDALPLTQNGKVDRGALMSILADEFRSPPPADTGPALSEADTQLVGAWRQILNDPGLGADSDFFRCGGDSLLATELALVVGALVGREISAATIHRFGTPRVLANWLQDPESFAGEFACNPVREMSGEGAGAPVIFVPGLGGYGLIPRPLGQALAGRLPYFDRAFYPSQRAGSTRTMTVEQIAAGLIDQIRSVRPAGPYILTGYSFGGFVAFELARQLAALGEQVEHVIL